eukprot:TRINITY_DN10263_c0_g2_i2.p3 TRINITY_DN10263_c0_g2~~TRINITY_DN10263_c0_g2_i2.p3  ORF type:complete len:259 (-),score=37.66 TRINITY_DN10263_c0_g2_i2:861-1637(-)
MLQKTLGLIGGSGKLGTALLSLIKKSRWRSLNLDYTVSPLATQNILIDMDVPMSEQIQGISEKVGKYEDEFDALISFAGNPPGTAQITDTGFFDEYDSSFKSNVESAMLRTFARSLVSHLCANYAAPHCFIVYTGNKHVFDCKEGNMCTCALKCRSAGVQYWQNGSDGCCGADGEKERSAYQLCHNHNITVQLPSTYRDKLMDKKMIKATRMKKVKNQVEMDKMVKLILAWMKGVQRPDNGTFTEFIVDGKFVFPKVV